MSEESSRPIAGQGSSPTKADDLAGTIANDEHEASAVPDEAGTVDLSDPGPETLDPDLPVIRGPNETRTAFVVRAEDPPTIVASQGVIDSTGIFDPPATNAMAATLAAGPNAADATGAFSATEAATGAFDLASFPQPAATNAFEATGAFDSAATGAFAETQRATGAYDPNAPNVSLHTELFAPTEPEDRARGVAAKRTKGADGKPRCGRYILTKFFARGGMGEVWLAEDPVIGRSVALKRMLGQRPEQRMRFRVEAQITGQLEHPGIVPIHELGANDAGEPFYVMKFVQGRTLKTVVEEFHAKNLTGGARDLEQLRLLQMFLSLCQTVAYAHSRGVLHRDLKPENVMLGPYGETILLDWGIAKILGRDDVPSGAGQAEFARIGDTIPDTGTHAGAIMGTPSYMSPEVASGLNEEVDERSDIYLLGATLFEVLSGQQPRTAKTLVELLNKAKTEPAKSVRALNPLVPKALDAICLKAMALRKEDRYQSAIELAEDLQRFVAGEPVSAYREDFLARAWRWARRNRKALGRSAAAVGFAAFTLTSVLKIRESERLRVEANRVAVHLREQDQARRDLAEFRQLADEASFYAATTEPVSEHAPYYDPAKGEATSRAALAVAANWGPALERLPLPEARAAVKIELYNLLLLNAFVNDRLDAGPSGAKDVLATLDRAERLSDPTVSAFQLRARAHARLGEGVQAAEFRKKADDPKAARMALDDFLQGEQFRDESTARVGDQTERKPWQPDPVRMEKAIGQYRRALAVDPDHFWSRLQLGRCYQSLGRFAEAVEALGACVAIRPNAPWGYSALGLALAQQGRHAEAEYELNKAILQSPDARPPRLHRGVVYWRQKKYDLALADFQAVLELPDEKRLIEACYYRGQLYLQLGELDKALADFDRLISASPGFRSVYLDRPLILLAKGDVPRTLADLDSYIALTRKVDRNDWEIHGLRGRILRFLYSQIPVDQRSGPAGRAALDLALAELMKAVQMGGRVAGVFDDLGAMMEHAGRPLDAITSYTLGLEKAPNDAKLLIKRGWALELVNQHARAQADFAAAALADPENAEAHSALGYVQAVRKLPPDAQREAELALLHGNESYLVLHNVACIYASLSQTADTQGPAFEDVAIALLRRSVKLWKQAGTGPNEIGLMKSEAVFKPFKVGRTFRSWSATARIARACFRFTSRPTEVGPSLPTGNPCDAGHVEKSR